MLLVVVVYQKLVSLDREALVDALTSHSVFHKKVADIACAQKQHFAQAAFELGYQFDGQPQTLEVSSQERAFHSIVHVYVSPRAPFEKLDYSTYIFGEDGCLMSR